MRRLSLVGLVLVCACTHASSTDALGARHLAAPSYMPAAPHDSSADSSITVYQVSPTTADPGAAGPTYPNLAMVGPASSWNNLLVVFLPGSGGQPSCCEMFLTEAASLGFHVIGLTYDNATSIGSRCENDLSCYGTVRQNVFNGTDPSVYSQVEPEDGIEHRLVALLSYLGRRHRSQEWRAFLSGGLPDYAKTVFTGHSQGGGEAAFIGIERALAGVVSLSSPPDTNSADQAAPWLYDVPTGATRADGYYAFVHEGDPFYARITADWTAMGLDSMGPLTSVDTSGAPYNNSHELISSAPLPNVLLAAHDSTAVDDAQPLCPDGASMYVPVWRYLLQAAAGLPLSGPSGSCGK